MSRFDEHKFSLYGASPDLVADYMLTFLKIEVPSHFPSSPTIEEDQDCQMSATVFIDFIPIGIDVDTYKNKTGATVIAFKHTSGNDIVRFGTIVHKAVSHLKSLGLGLKDSNIPPQKLQDDFFLSESSDDGAQWSEKCNQVDINSNTNFRQESFQFLAQWAASDNKSHPAIAKTFVDSKLGNLFLEDEAPLACLYPAALALQDICCKGVDTEACEMLINSEVFATLESLKLSSLPPLVSEALSKATHGLRLWKVYSNKFAKSPASGPNGFLSGSTRCTDTNHIEEFDDDSEAAL